MKKFLFPKQLAGQTKNLLFAQTNPDDTANATSRVALAVTKAYVRQYQHKY